MDQATSLRNTFRQRKANAAGTPPVEAIAPTSRAQDGRAGASAAKMRVIAVTSGKGGVGKTNLTLNLCIGLSRLGKKVFLLDADMGLANVDVLLGMSPRYTLEHVLSGQKELMEIVLEGPGGFKVLPASSGISELSELSYDQQMHLFRALSRMDAEMDYLFIDTGAGISSNVLRFNATAHEVILIANPEPTSITDCYALMKLLSIKYHLRSFSLIANSVLSDEEGVQVYERLNKAATQFLNVNLRHLGSVPLDKAIPKSVRQQKPVLELYPGAAASKALMRIASLLDQPLSPSAATPSPAPGMPGSTPNPSADPNFWDRLLHWKRVK